MRKLVFITIILGLEGILPAVAVAKITLTAGRGENSLGVDLPSDEDKEVLLNKQDCIENINVGFTVKDDDDSSGTNLYLVKGTDCDTRDNRDECEFFEVTGSGVKKEIHLRTLLGFDSADECKGESKTTVWAGRLDDTVEKTGSSVWSTNSIKITWDMDAPKPPDGLSLRPGENKVEVRWIGDGTEDAGTSDGDTLDADVETIYILYEKVGGASRNTAGSDTDTLPESSTAGDSETEDLDAGVDAGSDPAAQSDPIIKLLGLSSSDTDSAATVKCTSSDGFAEGEPYDPDIDRKEVTNPSSGKGEVGSLTNGVLYRFALVALDEYRNASVLSEVDCATPNVTRGFLPAYLESGGKVGEFCFVATAAFGSYDHPVVRQLRLFRDRFLAVVPGGRLIIAAYYELGPKAAAVVADHPILRGATQVVLALVACAVMPLGLLGPIGMLMVSLALLMGGVLVARRRRK